MMIIHNFYLYFFLAICLVSIAGKRDKSNRHSTSEQPVKKSSNSSKTTKQSRKVPSIVQDSIAAALSFHSSVYPSTRHNHTATSRDGVVIVVGTGKIGDDVRVCLRSLAVNTAASGNSNVILIADHMIWKHLQHEVMSDNVQGLNLLVLNYNELVAASRRTFYEVASARFYCIYQVLKMLLYDRHEHAHGHGKRLTHSRYAWHNITHSHRGIPRDVGVVLTCDIRDVIFQRDPFKQFWYEMDRRGNESSSRGMMVISQENPRVVSKCPVNTQWVDVCFGPKIAPLLGNIYCSGSMMASPILMYSFLTHVMVPSMNLCKTPMHGFDQGVFNVITHFPEYSNNRLTRNAFLSANKATRTLYSLAHQYYHTFNPIQVLSTVKSGWITTMGAGYFNDSLQRLMTRNGTDIERPCALCHQFDRDKSWKRRFKRLYNKPLNASLPTCEWLKDPYNLGDSCLFRPQYPEFYAKVQETIQNPQTKVPLCIGIIAYQGFKTLSNTLNTYTQNHLLDVVEESMILFQQIDNPSREAYANVFIQNFTKFSKPPIIEKNNTIFAAFGKIAQSCTAKYVLVLEEDFALYVKDKEDVVEQLLAPIHLIEMEGLKAVRMRRRHHMGEPDYILNAYRKGGGISESHYISHVSWQDYAEDDFPNHFRICMNAPKAWCTTSFYADYTNNPTLYETSFLRELMTQAKTAHENHITKFESELIALWRPKRYGVGWVDGLFTHDRLDRSMTLP